LSLSSTIRSEVYQKLAEANSWDFVSCFSHAHLGVRLWTFGEISEGNGMPALGVAWRVRATNPTPAFLSP
jgi:hypothetical protein